MEMPERISISQGVCGGEPVIQGTRIPVYAVVDLVAAGKTTEEILRDYYETLKPADIQACLKYAAMVVRDEAVHAA